MDVTAADTERIERSPEFRELVAARRRFVLPATVFFLVWYLGFILLAGYAPGFMGESVVEGLTVGYVLALSQFLMTAVLGVLYLRRADNTWDPLREKAVEAAQREVDAREGRFEHSAAHETRRAPEVPR